MSLPTTNLRPIQPDNGASLTQIRTRLADNNENAEVKLTRQQQLPETTVTEDQVVANAARVEPANNASCDRCNRSIKDIRYKCGRCPDFDYCADCVRLASSIHPGHDFVALRGHDRLSEEELQKHEHLTQQESLGPATFRLVGHDTSMPTALCASCQPVTQPLPAIGTILQDEGIRRRGQKSVQLRWPARISKLVEATVGGCAFCSLVLYRFFGPGNGIMYGYDPDVPWMCQVDTKNRKDVIANAMHLLTLMPNDEFVFAVDPIREEGLNNSDVSRLRIELNEAKQAKDVLDRALASRGQQYIELDVYAAEGNPAADLITARPPNPSPGAPEALAQVKSWLAQCEQTHGKACNAGPSPLPSRVIDISDSPRLRLLESSATTGRYVALSYCWGEAQEFQTTTASLADRIEGFALSDLPPTLQDAVTVTKALDMDYLWIDSICIMQDNPHDRATEVRGMAEIYKRATLTLSASRAGAVSNGFLQDRANPETGLWNNLVPLGFPILDPAAKSIQEAFEMPRSVFGTVWLCDEDRGMMSTFRSPVDRRGWCLQERLLSSRLLSYGRWPTWRCGRGTYSDGGFFPHNAKTERHEWQLTKCLSLQTQSSPAGFGVTDMHTSTQLLRSWYTLLAEYTQRELGVKTDRLPAIGGIAAEIFGATGFPYLAGLWQPNLLHDLMWSARTKEWLARIEGYKGPSWSWAAVDCPISYDQITEDSLALARVLSCKVTPGESGPFGEVQDGSNLEIEGPFLARVAREDLLALIRDQGMGDPPPRNNDVSQWYRQIMDFIESQPRNNTGPANENWEDTLLEQDDVSAIITFSREWRVRHETREEGVFYSGLLLRRVVSHVENGTEEGYERIGAFFNEKREWLDLVGDMWTRRKVVLL